MGERRKLRAADLFCGAGGTSTGAIASGAVDVVLAVNHWLVAVNSHLENHKSTRHVCAEIDMVDPRDFVEMGLDLLLASPECIFHSNARGGKPVDDQRRATAWCVPRWAEVLKPKWIVVENVREFKDWGPLIEKRCRTSGRILKDKGKTAWVPDKTRKGEIFNAWVAALKGIGYHVEYRLLNAADFGAATKRVRLFVIARYGKSTAPIPWPVPTHKPEHYTPAAAVIDWSLPTPSIFTRKRPLSEKTLRRIEIGVRKFAGPDRKPFLVDRNWQENRGGRNRVHSIDDPLTTITTQGGQAIVNLHGKSTAHGIDEALPTVTGKRNLGIADAAFITPNFGEHERQQPRTHSVEEPVPTVTSRGAGNLVQPFLLPRQGVFDCQKDKPPASVDAPLNTITAGHSPAALVAPFVVKAAGSGYNDANFEGVTDAAQPMPTIVGKPNHALVAPFIAKVRGSGVDNPTYTGVHDVQAPMPTILTDTHHALVKPFVVGYHGGTDPNRDGTERQTGVDEPLPVIDTNPRYALAAPFQYQMTGRGAGRSASIEEPVPTIIAARETHGVIQPFLTQYNGTGGANSVEEPLTTVTAKERQGLAVAARSAEELLAEHIQALRLKFPDSPGMQTLLNTMEELEIVDIGYRMLVNDELKLAQGFPKDYLLFGTQSEVTKQIGNSVHTYVSEAICRALATPRRPRARASA